MKAPVIGFLVIKSGSTNRAVKREMDDCVGCHRLHF
jgi:hypothetical protein